PVPNDVWSRVSPARRSAVRCPSAATGGREPPRGALAGDPARGQGPSLPARRGRAPAARAGRPTP
ncbi:unnamed protein product, partial [Lampetra planeri]